MPHAVGGNIGTPLIEQVDGWGRDDWAVLELSELQLPTIPRGADIAVYTNIGADHLDRHGSRGGVPRREGAAGGAERRRGIVVLNADDAGMPRAGRLAGRRPALVWPGRPDRRIGRRCETRS